MAGRFVLSQSMTSAIPSYVMQGALLPGKVLNTLDKLNRDFVWGSTTAKKILHLVSWKKITKPKSEGGLGLQASKPKNLGLVAKLCWRFKTSHHEPWVEVLRHKYLANSRIRKYGHSRTWAAIVKGEVLCNKGSRWVIGTNNVLNFWFDKWLCIGTIRSLVVGPLNRGEDTLKISDILIDGTWLLHNLSFELPSPIKLSIKATPARRVTSGIDSLC
jgi:hypothetical protein